MELLELQQYIDIVWVFFSCPSWSSLCRLDSPW